MNVRTTLNSIKYCSKASLEQSHIMAPNESTVQELSFEWCTVIEGVSFIVT